MTPRQRAAVAIGLVGTLAGVGAAAPRARQGGDEVRALWVLRTALSSPAAVHAMVTTARASGFNTLLVQVRGRGDAYFADGIEPRAAILALQPARFDPLATAIAAAHDAGLKVHAWVNVALVAGAADLPVARGHIVYRHPEWLMVPRALAESMAVLDPISPAYVGTLARWTRGQAGIEGLYLSPIPPASATYTESVVADLVARYEVDGVHFDYARYPNEDFDYSAAAISEFRGEMVGVLPAGVRARLDAQMAADRFAYPDAFPERWYAFRRSRLMALVARLRTAVKRARPASVVSAAVTADAREAIERRLQDWPTWLEQGLLDVACPMAYTTDASTFEAQVAAARELAKSARAIWAGIGAYRLAPRETIDHIQTARRLDVGGLAIFSYDSLTDPAQSTIDYLGQVGRAVFADVGGF